MSSASITRRPASVAELPLSAFQRRWWEMLATYGGVCTPVVSLVYRLRGPLDVGAWLRAVDALVERHETLRTTVTGRAGTPVQRVSPPGGLVVDRVDLSDQPAEVALARARDLLNEARSGINDLEDKPLTRSSLVRLAEDDHLWSFTVHHIMADGVSAEIILDELGALYRSEVTGTAADLAPVAAQYGDYVLWQLADPDPLAAEDLAFWRDQLAGVPPLELSSDPAHRTKGTAGEVRHPLDADLTRAVEDLARQSRATRFMVLLAANLVGLAKESGQDDFCVGVALRGADRLRPELARTVGLFNNSVAIRPDLTGDPTFRELLVATRDRVLDAFDHERAAIGHVIDAIDPRPRADQAQLFQVMFGMDETGASGLTLPDVRVEPFALPLARTLHDLMLLVFPVGDGLVARFVHDGGIIDGDRVARLGRWFEATLRAAVADPDTPVSRLID